LRNAASCSRPTPAIWCLIRTCGSGTTAYVAEQWGRRWITVDTSRVALALARARIMGARYPYYLLADSKDGQQKEAEVTTFIPPETATTDDIRQGFVHERVPHVTLHSIAHNAEINASGRSTRSPLNRFATNSILPSKTWEEWEIPREADAKWPEHEQNVHAEWWQQRMRARRKSMPPSRPKLEFEYLYDKPYDDKRKVRVAGPFTVESLSPHRVLAVDENDELIDGVKAKGGDERDFVRMIMENLKTAGVQQAHKEDKVTFSSITPWPGNLGLRRRAICGGRGREARRHLHWPGVRDSVTSRFGGCCARGWRLRLRCADRLRVQLRRPLGGNSISSAAFRS